MSSSVGPRPPLITIRSGPTQRAFDDIRELADIVGDDSLQTNVVADRVQPLGDDERIGVDAKRRQHLAADREDAGLHELGNRVIG